MSIYGVFDAHGNSITEGLQGPEVCDEAAQVAQRIADSRGEPVWLCRIRTRDEVNADYAEYDDSVEYTPTVNSNAE